MNILWVVNTIFPDAAIKMGLNPPVVGGWMYGLAKDVAACVDVRLAVATVYSGRDFSSFVINGIHYFLIPATTAVESDPSVRQHWAKLLEQFPVDLVHIHGTEYGHGYSLMKAYPELPYLVSIQGLVSVCHQYYLAGMTALEVIRNITLRDILRWDTLFQAKKAFSQRGEVERDYIRRASAVIGRTEWDFAHAKAINPDARYHFCNESLRDEFYSGERWSNSDYPKHVIFLSQGSYPIKGLHQVIKAVALLKDEYPAITVEVAGADITKNSTFMERIKRTGYGKYVASLIKRYGLESKIKFLGPLQADEMKRAYLRSHVFICPSSIENSPNSLGEAQLLGVPCIAAYCGGIPSMTNGGESAALYRFEEFEMLALKIREFFEDAELADRISERGAFAASVRHDKKKNLDTLMSIYSSHRGDKREIS